jgi:hypothetical protein
MFLLIMVLSRITTYKTDNQQEEIPTYTQIINSIDFETDINKKEIAELMEFLEKTVIKEPEYFVIKKVQAWKKISVKASVKNIDILMKYAKSLPPDIEICFSSRHKKTMNSIYRTCFELMD